MISLPTILYIPICWLIPDTPRWFLRKGRIEEAVGIIENAMSVNKTKQTMSGSELRTHLMNHVELSSQAEPAAKWNSLWNDRRDVMSIIAIHVAWAAFVTNYTGMMFNVKAFGREHLSVHTIALGEFFLLTNIT